MRARYVITWTVVAASLLMSAGVRPALAAGPMGINGLTFYGTRTALPSRSTIHAIAQAGAGWVRVEFNTAPWGGTDSPAFYTAYDQLIGMYRSEGIQVLALVDYETLPGPQSAWQANNREHDGGDGDNDYIVGFGAIVARIAQHFQDRITYWEVWNEPNVWTQQPSPGVFTGGSYIYPSNFAAMLAEVYAQSKIFTHIHVQFVSGGLFGHSIGNVYDCVNAGAGYLDATYREGNATGKFPWARAHIGTDPLDAVGQHIYISQGGVVTEDQVHQYLDCMHKTQVADDTTAKKIWVTEFGWQTPPVSADQQGRNLATAFHAMQDSGLVQDAISFTLQDFPNGNWGIFTEGCDISQASCRKASYPYEQQALTYEGRLPDGSVDQGLLSEYQAGGGQPVLGSPFDNGGGAYVHGWSATGTDVQDFAGGTLGPSILVDGPNGTFIVTGDFRSAYIGGAASSKCKSPLDNAFPDNSGGNRQDFIHCFMTEDPGTGVVIHYT